MVRLPQPGGDSGNWGTILNDYLSQIHNNDGTLKDNVVTNKALAPDAVDETSLVTGAGTDGQVLVKDSQTSGGMAWKTPSGGTVGNATTTNVGLVQLAGDLGGTATAPTVPSLANKADKSNTYTKTEVDTALSAKANTSSLSGYIPTGQKAAAGGVASLDSSGKVPSAQLPAISSTLASLTDVNASSPANNQVLAYDSTSSKWVANTVTSTTVTDATSSAKGIVQLAGDLSGSAGAPTVARVQGTAVSTTGPTDGQVLTYDNVTAKAVWKAPVSSGSGGGYTVVSGVTSGYNAKDGEYILASASGGEFIVNLPTPASGAQVCVKKIDNSTNSVTIKSTVAIDDKAGTVGFSLPTQWWSQDFLSDGTQWYCI